MGDAADAPTLPTSQVVIYAIPMPLSTPTAAFNANSSIPPIPV